MKRLALLLALIPSAAEAWDNHDALKRGYVLNGYSMVRWAAIDLSKGDLVQLIPTVPVPAEPKKKPK